MMAENLIEHLKTGTTTVCRAWQLLRTDGVGFAFTDHDRPLTFEGNTFRAQGGLTASALQQTSGLSVDNSEALGALQSDVITQEDIAFGLYDGAEVMCWQVNWRDVNQRRLLYRAFIGQVTWSQGAFQAELRGLTDLLNQPQGRSYYKTATCSGTGLCGGYERLAPGFFTQQVVDHVVDGRVLYFDFSGFDEAWFVDGVAEVMSGDDVVQTCAIRTDMPQGDLRRIELFQTPRRAISAGDQVRLIAGCAVRQAASGDAIDNCNFPFIPGEDWLLSTPLRNGVHDGGSMN